MAVATVVSRTVAPLLIATNPLVPRENAIAFAPLSHQWLMSVPATTWRKPTMFRIDGSRCSHTHWPTVAVSRLAAQLTAVVQPLASDGRPIELPPRQMHAQLDTIERQPYGCAHI